MNIQLQANGWRITLYADGWLRGYYKDDNHEGTRIWANLTEARKDHYIQSLNGISVLDAMTQVGAGPNRTN